MKKFYTNATALLFLLILSPTARCQIEKPEVLVQIGANINFYFAPKRETRGENFPGIKVYAGISGYNYFGSSINKCLINYSTNLVLYNRSIGNSLNLNNQDNQLDWTSNLSVGLIHGSVGYFKHSQTINNSPFQNLQHDARLAAIIGVNFITNNHRRNQTVGNINLNYKNFSLNYYNDGGFPMNLGLGDNFDRWWTGGLAFYIHNTLEFNTLELSFDQFTGYRRQLYQLTHILGMDIQDYDFYEAKLTNVNRQLPEFSIESKGQYGYNYNTSTYQVKYTMANGLSINGGILGSIRMQEKEKYFALQDIIHLIGRKPIHPNNDTNRFNVGLSYFESFKY